MTDMIKIDSNLRFDFFDLMTDVDPDHEFTLRDVLEACKNSKIPIEILEEIIQCRYLKEYFEEADKEDDDNEPDDEPMECLELYWIGDSDTYDRIQNMSHQWGFHGVGQKGVIPKDILEHSTEEEIQEMKDNGFRQAYAIEFTPVYQMADLPIKISKEMQITDWDKSYGDGMCKTIEFRPSISLIEVLYSIFWEISFCGSPEQRDDKMKSLGEALEEYKKSIKPTEENQQ